MPPGLRFCPGAPGPIRTADTRFRRAVLYPLSYEGRLCPAIGGARTNANGRIFYSSQAFRSIELKRNTNYLSDFFSARRFSSAS